jgi:outer membrane protein, heavy metal efflux system
MRLRGSVVLWCGLVAAGGIADRSLAAEQTAQPAVTDARPTPQTPEVRPPTLGVESLVERALARAPSLTARRERIEAARAAARAADALPEPMIEFMYQAFNFPRYTIGEDPMSMAGASIRQQLLSSGRRTIRSAIARAEVSQRAAERLTLAADLATEVRLQYARLYTIDHEREILANAKELVRLLEATVTARYATGETDQASVLRVQLEGTRIDEQLADLAAERTAVQAALNRLTNDPPETPIAPVTILPPPALPAAAASLPEAAAKDAPVVALRRTELDLATRRVDEARQELRPGWTVGGAVYWQGGLDRVINLNVGVELPWWKNRKQLPLIAAAEAERRAARLELEGASAEVRAEAAGLLAEWQNAVSQIERYQSAILPQNSAALDATRASYLGGRADFASVVDELRRWIEVRIQLAGREADRFSAQARLAALVDRTAGGQSQ